MSDQLDADIEAASARVDSLEIELTDARRHLQSLALDRVARDYGVRIGDRVRRSDSKEEGIVESINQVVSNRKPWVTARLFKQNGRLGNRVINFYREWETVAAAQASEGAAQ